MRHLLCGFGVLALGAGCCLTPANPASGSTTGASSGSGTTGGSSTSGATGGGTSSGGTGASGFIGTVEVGTLTVVAAQPDAGFSRTFFHGSCVPTSAWVPCPVDAGACCFFPSSAVTTGLSAGVLTVSVTLVDGGFASSSVSFDPASGIYSGLIFLPAGGLWFASLAGAGDEVPAFSAGPRLQGPNPVLTPELSQLSSLSVSQDWVVPLTPSDLEYLFTDRVIVQADGVGQIVCEASDEGFIRPPLVVPASLLASFKGHRGTVALLREDATGWIDAGTLLLDYRVGIRTETLPNGVTFTP